MGREQGDELGDEITYVHPEHPEYGERPAVSPVDVVNLEARGWVPKDRKGGQKTSGGDSASRKQATGGSDAAPAASS